MKRIAATGLLAGILMMVSAVRNPVSAQFSATISFQAFYDELDPYGNWIEYPDYGYVWQPQMGAGFRPYSTGGQWVWTEDYGWTWASEYSWGWAPFHYGRWFHDPYYGWLWVPGYDWSPAWVAWRGGGDYYGWAPLSPQVRIGINFSFGHYSPPADYWCFAPRQYIASPRIYNHCVNVQRNTTIIHNTTIINERHHRGVFATGPSRFEVERYTRQRIQPATFRTSSRPSQSSFRRNELTLYRPSVSRDNNRRYAPQRVERMDRDRRSGIADNRPDNRFRNQRMEQSRREQRIERNEPRVDERMNRQRNADGNVFERRRETMRRNDMENGRNEQRRQFEQRNQGQRNFEQRRMEQPRMEQPGRQQPRNPEQRNVEQRRFEQRGGGQENAGQRNFEQRRMEQRNFGQRGGNERMNGNNNRDAFERSQRQPQYRNPEGRQEQSRGGGGERGIRRENPGNQGGGQEGRRGRQ
jgi:hypothetical protein